MSYSVSLAKERDNPGAAAVSERYARLLRACLGSRETHRGKGRANVRKPANLIYGVNEDPPPSAALVLALQHLFVISVGWIFVVVLVTSIGGTTEQSQSIIRLSMIISGLATVLQARVQGPIGSGYLCPFSCGPAYLSAAILAGKTGGLPLVFGMTTVSGLFEGLFSRVMHRLRSLFPPEVTGLVVAMVGVALINLGCPRFLGYSNSGIDLHAAEVGILTLIAMVAPTVWSKGKWRLYPVLIGMSVGYVSSLLLGVSTAAQLRTSLAVPILALPHRVSGAGWSIRAALLAPFLIASVSSVLKTVGDITLCQKINNAEWKRTDMKSVSGGILAGSLGTTVAGLIGGVGQSTFSSNVGLSMATGATSGAVAVPIGLLLVALAFFPKIAAIFAAIPQPVVGAMLIYVACFMVVGGFQVVTSRMLDARRTFVVGIALVFGLSVDMVPGLYARVPDLLRPLFASSLSLATVLVVTLNLLFRLGVAQERALDIDPRADNLDTILNLMEQQGGAWGMRKEVASAAADAIYELVTSVSELGVISPLRLRLRFDEFKLEADLHYCGQPVQLPETPPSVDELAEGNGARAMLSGYLVRQYADHVHVSSADDHCHVHLLFEH